MRAAYILADQLAFEAEGETTPEHVVTGIKSLRQSLLTEIKGGDSAGFPGSALHLLEKVAVIKIITKATGMEHAGI